MVKRIKAVLLLLIGFSGGSFAQKHTLQFIFCSDVHFGLTKPVFRNSINVSTADVNSAIIEQMNALPAAKLPED